MIDLEGLKYAELQKLAKVHGVRANQKAAVLKEQLAKILAQDAAAAAAGEGSLDDAALGSANADSVQSPAVGRILPAESRALLPPCATIDVDGNKENQAAVHRQSSDVDLSLPLAAASAHGGAQKKSPQAVSSPPCRQSDAAGTAAPSNRPSSRRSSLGRRSARADSSASCQSHSEATSSGQLPLPGCSPILPGAACSGPSRSATSLAPGSDDDVNSSLLDSSLGLVDGSFLDSTSESRDDAGLTRSADCRSSARLRSSVSAGSLDVGNDCTFVIDDHRTDVAILACTSNRSCRSASTRTPPRCPTADVDDSRRSSVFALTTPSASSPTGRPSSSFGGTADSSTSVVLDSRVTRSRDSNDGAAPAAGRPQTSGGRRNRSRSSTARSAATDLDVEMSPFDGRPEQPACQEGRLPLPSDDPSSAAAGGAACTSADGGDELMSIMQRHQHMSDDELKASLLAALDRQTELRQAEIAERVAKARAQAQTASTRKDGAASGSSKMRHTPNFASIHAKRFAKMESIQSYVDRKRQKFEDSNRLLGLSSPQLSQSSGTSRVAARREGAAKTTANTLRSTKPWPHASVASAATTTVSFATRMSPRTSATASVLSTKPLFGASSAGLQQESKTSGVCSSSTSAAARGGGGARIVKPLRGGGGGLGSSRGITAARAVQRPTAPPARLAAAVKPAVPSHRSTAATLPGIVSSPTAAAVKPFNFCAVGGSHAAAASGSSGLGLTSGSSNILNTTFTISRTPSESKAGTSASATTKSAALQPSFGAQKPAAAAAALGYKKPALKTSEQRRAEALASAKDRRQAAMMHRRLADG